MCVCVVRFGKTDEFSHVSDGRWAHVKATTSVAGKTVTQMIKNIYTYINIPTFYSCIYKCEYIYIYTV